MYRWGLNEEKEGRIKKKDPIEISSQVVLVEIQ
jgi:hypothetical protein